MGCYPLGKLVSKALGRCKGKESWRRRRAAKVVLSSPPRTVTHSRSVSKTVTFSNDNPIIIIPAEPTSSSATGSRHHTETLISPSPHASNAAVSTAEAGESKDHAQARPAGGPPESHGGVSYGRNRQEPVPAYSGLGHCYAPSPLPVWDERPRREYFGGEYHYYPTPIREGIYSIATDANRLTAMFSEENPNACSIA